MHNVLIIFSDKLNAAIKIRWEERVEKFEPNIRDGQIGNYNSKYRSAQFYTNI